MIEFSKYNKIAGIYKWENKINHKCYIGQSINLNKRLRTHFCNIKSKKYTNPLYTAIEKYGIDNFDLEILETIEMCDNIKELLDERECYYIQYYGSYKNGYNQTLGGDGGILGYKFTDKQRLKVSENSKIQSKKLYKHVYLYNIISNEYLDFDSISVAAKYLKCNHSQISRVCNYQQRTINDSWVGSFSKDDLESRILFIKDNPPKYTCGKSAKERKRPTPGLKRHFNTPTGKKILSRQHKDKISKSLCKYKIEIYKNDILYKIYDSSIEANEFFNYKTPNHLISEIRKYIKNGWKYKKEYTFKIIDTRKR